MSKLLENVFVGCFTHVSNEGLFCVWPCADFFSVKTTLILIRSLLIYYLYLFIIYNILQCMIGPRLHVSLLFFPTVKICFVIDMSETRSDASLSLCLSLSGLSKSTAKGLDKTHQESTQAGPQLQLQTHPPWLQECWQWQVGVCCEDAAVCLGMMDLSICLFSPGLFLPHDVTADICAVSVLWKPVKPESPVCHFKYGPLFLTVTLHDESSVHVWVLVELWRSSQVIT